MTKPNDSPESTMLTLVRKWRKEAFEARRQADAREQARQDQELIRSFGLESPPSAGDRRSSAA